MTTLLCLFLLQEIVIFKSRYIELVTTMRSTVLHSPQLVFSPRCQNTQHNNTLHKGTLHKGLTCDTEHNALQHPAQCAELRHSAQFKGVTSILPYMLRIVMLDVFIHNVVMVNIPAPICLCLILDRLRNPIL